MKNIRTALAAATLLSGLFICFVSAQPKAYSDPDTHLRPIRQKSEPGSHESIRQLVGRKVENHDGQRLGKIKNFIVDLHSGTIPFAVLSSGGVLGVRSELKIVPASMVSTATAKKGIVALELSRAQWAKAPRLRKRTLEDPEQMREVYQFYSQALASQEKAKATRHIASDKKSASFRLALEMMDKNVLNPQGADIGRLSDMLLDLVEHNPALAVISSQSQRNKGRFTIPLASLILADGERFTMKAEPSAPKASNRL